MRRRSGTVVAVVLALVGSGSGGTAFAAAHASAAASSASSIYVDETNTACSDTGAGTQAAPYCTLQPAFDAVVAGQTIEVVAGTYTGPVTLSASGTASAHITLQFGQAGQPFQSTGPQIDLPSGTVGSALTLSGARYVDIEDAGIVADDDTAPAIDVQDSSHVLISGANVSAGGSGGGIAIAGTGTDVTVERDVFSTGGPAVSVSGGGVSGTVVSTNEIGGVNGTDTSGGVSVDGALGTDVVGNTISDVCTSGVAVFDAARGTVVENNVISVDAYAVRQCPDTTASALGIYVSADAAPGTVEKYDTVGLSESTPISWAGTNYTLVKAYQAFTGQGAGDLLLTGDAAQNVVTVPADYVDSADARAPGEPSTDFTGAARADDPRIPNTGTGVGYYDRGATELQDNFVAELSQVQPLSPSSALGVSVSFIVGLCTNWGATSYTGTVDWGDGKSSRESGSGCTYQGGSATHTYAKPGQYTVTFAATDGFTRQSSSQVFATQGTDYTPYGPTRVLDTRKGTGAPEAPVAAGSYVKLKIAGNGAIPADVTAVALNLTVTDATGGGYLGTSPDRNGGPSEANLRFTAGQTTADTVVVKVDPDGCIDIYNEAAGGSADIVADVAGYFAPSASSGYQAVPPTRVLDTRRGTGAPAARIPAHSGIDVTVAGVGAIPDGVTAVAVHLTVPRPAGGGWIAAEPEPAKPSAERGGTGVPDTSAVNYGTGVTASNTLLVPVAPDGKIELYNGGGTAVDVVADVSGYFSASAPGTFMAVDPVRAVTATGTHALAASSSGRYALQAPQGTEAVIGTLTVSRPTAGGGLAAYPDHAARPAGSAADFRAGQSLAAFAVLDTATGEGAATNLYNASTGAVQLYVDVYGYFTG